MNDYLPGPDPIITPPDPKAVIAAEKALHEAVVMNKARKRVMTGITQEQAELLLDDIAYQGRCHLVENTSMNQLAKLTDELWGNCGNGQGHTGHLAELLGLKTHYFSLEYFDKKLQGFAHGALVIYIPVKQEDKVYELPYLKDITYRQYFGTHAQASTIGEKTAKSPEGREMADAILRKGYVALTPSVAFLYTNAFCKNGCRITPEDDLIQFSLIGVTRNDFRPGECAKYNMPLDTPLMRQNGIGLNEVLSQRGRDLGAKLRAVLKEKGLIGGQYSTDPRNQPGYQSGRKHDGK